MLVMLNMDGVSWCMVAGPNICDMFFTASS